MNLLGWPFSSRFSSPEMFSFSLNPEVVSFLWKTKSSVDLDTTPRYPVAYPTSLFQILLFSEPEESASLLTTIHSTVVTTGILVIVGLSSFSTFKLLQCIRHEEHRTSAFETLKRVVQDLVRPFILHWRRYRTEGISSEAVITPCRTKNNNSNGRQLCKRPSDLNVLGNGSPRGNRLFQSSRENSLERRLLVKDRTPLADCDIASGEEDIADIQGQYFGPTVRSTTFCGELLGSSPEDSPVHASSPKKGTPKKSPKK